MPPKAMCKALAKGKAKAKAKAKFGAKAKPKARWPDPGLRFDDSSDAPSDDERERPRHDPPEAPPAAPPEAPPAAPPAGLTDADLLRVFRAGVLRGGLEQLTHMACIIWNRASEGRAVANLDGALPHRRGLPLPAEFPSGYIEFCELHAEVTTLKASWDAMSAALRRPMVARGRGVVMGEAVA